MEILVNLLLTGILILVLTGSINSKICRRKTRYVTHFFQKLGNLEMHVSAISSLTFGNIYFPDILVYHPF